MSTRWVRFCPMTCVAALAGIAAAVHGATPVEETYGRYHDTLAEFQRFGADAEAYLRREISRTAQQADGTALDPEALTGDLRRHRTRLEENAANLEAARREFDARRIDTSGFSARMGRCIENAITEVARVQFEETRRTVWLLTQRQRRLSRTLRDEHAQRAAPVRAQPDGRGRDAALAELQAQFAGRERSMLDEILRDYGALTRRFLDRRGGICGALWVLQDFYEKRGRHAEAVRIQNWIYAHWEVDLRARGQRYNVEGVDSLVITYANANTIDWLQLLPAFVPRGEFETNRHMDAAVRAEPVERFRRFDDTLPILAAHGDDLQALCEMLTTRLVRYHEVRARSQTLFTELRNQAARLPPASAEPLPDPATLAAALATWQTRRIDFEQAGERARNARADLATREAALARARDALDTARRGLRFQRSPLRIVDATARGAVTADQLLREKERAVATSEAQLRSDDVNAEQKRAIRAEALPRQRAELQEVRDAIVRALGEAQRTFDSAQSAVDAARAAVAAAHPADEGSLADAWAAVRTAANRARQQLPSRMQAGLPDLPYDQNSPRAAELAGQCLRGLRDSVAALDQEYAGLRNSLREQLSEVGRCDHELRDLARSISGIRGSTAVTVERVLQELGAPADDPMWTVVVNLRSDINAAKEALEPGDAQLDRLERLRARLTGNEQGAYLIEAARERLGTVIAVLGFIGERIDNLETLRTTHQQLQNPRTALAALGTLLETAGSSAQAVPVLGDTLGRFLNFYARAARAAGNAAIAIQDHVIDRSLMLFTRQTPPERHLYIADEIPESVPTSERGRVLKMLQVRRAVALLSADTAEEARNATYRP